MSSALATQKRDSKATDYNDPWVKLWFTQQLIKDDFLPALPKGVAKVWALAAYGSVKDFNDPEVASPEKRREQLALVIKHRFLTPTKSDPKHDLLKKAVDLATTDKFRKKRADLYKWQEEIIEENIPDEKAIEEMEKMLVDYNEAIENAFDEVEDKFTYTLIPIGLGVTGALLGGGIAPLILAGAAGAVALIKFWKLDSKLKIDAGNADAAAMLYDAQKLPLGDSQF
jgi:hypothetical protein